MNSTAKLPLNRIIEEFSLEVLYEPKNIDQIIVTTSDINRPGLQLVGFVEYFDSSRLQIMGKVEFTFLEQFSTEEREKRLERLFAMGFPALVITRGLQIFPEMTELAEKYNIPLLRCDFGSSQFMSMIIRYLNTQLAPTKTRHGVLCEIYGEGILIMGESGVGKSEAAIELVKRVAKDTPILLLDDVLSELDKHRQNYLLDSIHDIQALITCTGVDEFVNRRFRVNKVFHVREGHVTMEN